MAICCCFHRTPQSRLCSILFSLTIVVALHVFAFFVNFHASRQVTHCNNYGCGFVEIISAFVIVVCFVAEFIYLLAFAFPKYICPVDPREEPPTIPATSDEVRAMYRPMAAWYRAPARDALRKHNGEFPPTSEALLDWASFGPVATAFLDDQAMHGLGV